MTMDQDGDLRKEFGYEHAVLELYYWQHAREGKGRPTNFDSKLYDLIHKADSSNLEKIRKGFPYHVLAHSDWMRCGYAEIQEFYKRHVPMKFMEAIQKLNSEESI